MLDELTGNPLWEKLSKILDRMDQDEAGKLADFHRGMSLSGKPFAEIKIVRSTCRKYLQLLVFQNLQPLISGFNDSKYISAKIGYFKKYHDLTLDAVKLEELYVEMQVNMIRQRVEWILAYLDQHMENMFLGAMDGFIIEAHLSITNDNASFLEHPEMGEHELSTYPPLDKEIESILMRPYKTNVKARLGLNESGKPGRRPIKTQFNLIEGIVPLYRIYLRALKKIKEIDYRGAGEIEKYFNDLALEDDQAAKTEKRLYEIAKNYGDDPTKATCKALIDLHDLRYKPDSLYDMILDGMKDEEKIIETFRKLNLN